MATTITLSPVSANTATPNYPTRTYKALFENVSRIAGIEPDRILTDDSLALRDYINTSLRQGWEYYWWPDLMRVEQTTVANVDNYAEYDIECITKNDPRDKLYPTEYTWSVDADGINIINDLATTATIYIRYRDRFYPFSGTEWSSSTSYSIDDMAYFTSTGNYYRSLINANEDNAVSETTSWQVRPIPYFLYEFTKLACLADLREAEGQGEKSRGLKAQAGAALNLEIEKWERLKNMQRRPKVRLRSGG